MNKIPDYIRTIVLDCEGEVTKSRWIGTFKIKAVLSHADTFAVERMYARLLPSNTTPNEDMKIRAAVISELSVRVLEGPEWWNSTRYGQMMVDSEPLYKLAVKCKEENDKWNEELTKTAKDMGTPSNVIDTELSQS